MPTIPAQIVVFRKLLVDINMYYITWSLCSFLIFASDLRSKKVGIGTLVRITTIGFVFFAMQFTQKHYPSFVIYLAMCIIISAPWLVGGNLYKKLK
jgi:hypothetical protein